MAGRSIGKQSVSAIGLGEMPLSIEDRPDERRAMATVHAALEAGVSLIDTADAYCLRDSEHGHGEALVARALRSYGGDTSQVLVATKGGHRRREDGRWVLDGRPDYLIGAAQESLRRLGGEAIDLYQLHRPDPAVPYAESLGALRELLDAGTIRMAGVSNADLDRIRLAQQILGDGLVSVQNEFSPAFRSSAGELRYCADHGLAFLPWSPLGGISSAADLGRQHAVFAEVARAHAASPQRVCLAWLLAQGAHVIPIPGCSRPQTIRDSAAAAGLTLQASELARLNAPGADGA